MSYQRSNKNTNRQSKSTISYNQYRQSFPALTSQVGSNTHTSRSVDNTKLDYKKICKPENDILPLVDPTVQIKPGYVKIYYDNNTSSIQTAQGPYLEPIILPDYEYQRQYAINLHRMNCNIAKSQEIDKNRFIPISNLQYENSFNNDDLFKDDEYLEIIETSDSDYESDLE